MGKSIFQIIPEHRAIIQELEENEGLLEGDLEERLKISKEELGNKLDSYAYLIDELNGEKEMIAKEIVRLSKMSSVKENIIERLKKTMKEAIVFLYPKEQKYKTQLHSFTVVNTYAVDVDNLEEVPAQYIRALVTQKLTKREYLAFIKDLELMDEEEKAKYKLEINADKVAIGKVIKPTKDKPEPDAIPGCSAIKGNYIRIY